MKVYTNNNTEGTNQVRLKAVKRSLVILLAFTIFIACGNVSEDVVVSGGTYTVYPTVVYDGNLGGIAGADTKCMADANYPGTGTYKAMLVDGFNRIASVTANTGDGQVDWVLNSNSDYYLADGTTKILTTDSNGLFSFGNLDNTFNGLGYGGGPAWTGLNQDWTSSANNCVSWASANEVNTASFGVTSDTAETSISNATNYIPCSNSDTSKTSVTINFYSVLICVEQ